MRQRTHSGWQAEAIIAMRAHVVCVSRGLVHAGQEGGPTRGAHRRRGKNTCVPNALGCEMVQVWRADQFFTVATQVKFDVLPHNPENVRPPGLGAWGETGTTAQDQKRPEEPCHNSILTRLSTDFLILSGSFVFVQKLLPWA